MTAPDLEYNLVGRPGNPLKHLVEGDRILLGQRNYEIAEHITGGQNVLLRVRGGDGDALLKFSFTHTGQPNPRIRHGHNIALWFNSTFLHHPAGSYEGEVVGGPRGAPMRIATPDDFVSIWQFYNGGNLYEEIQGIYRSCEDADRRRMPYTLDQLHDRLVPVLLGLQTMHAEGVINLDVKLGNTLRCGEGLEQVLIDFELAREKKRGGFPNPFPQKDDEIVSTPLYTAPEVVIFGPVDHRVDLYSAAVMLYLMATDALHPQYGIRPRLNQTFYQVVTTPMTDVQHLPKKLQMVILKGLGYSETKGRYSLNPDARYGSAQEFLEGFLEAVDRSDHGGESRHLPPGPLTLLS
jgi:serine/threonine protein kinase